MVMLRGCDAMSPRRGYKQSEEHIRKRTEARRGGKLSEEHKRKISESMKGRKRSEEPRRKQFEAQMGRALSEEHKPKLSETKKGKSSTELTGEMVGLMCVQAEYFSWPTCRSRIEIIMLAYDSIFTRRREDYEECFSLEAEGLIEYGRRKGLQSGTTKKMPHWKEIGPDAGPTVRTDITFKLRLWLWIEQTRGEKSRSQYIRDILTKVMENA